MLLGFSLGMLGEPLRKAGLPGAWDFANGLPAGATLARASASTCCNVAGALASRAVDVPAYEYDPVTHAFRGLWNEPAGTNVALNSQDFTQASWSSANLTLAAKSITETAVNGPHRVVISAVNRVMTNGVPVVVSGIASELVDSSKRYFALSASISGLAAVPMAVFDLATGSLTLASNCTAGIVAAPGGWLWWASYTPNANTSTGGERYNLTNVSNTAAPSYLGEVASGINLSEVQFEDGTMPSTRIRTGGAAATRAAVVLTLPAAAIGVTTDGPITVRYTFDNGSTSDVVTMVSGGVFVAPTSARPLRRYARV